MSEYLNNWLSTQHYEDFGEFIIISNNYYDLEDREIEMEYDFSDGRLYIEPSFSKRIMHTFSRNTEQFNSFIKKWFEEQFGVEVKFLDNDDIY